MNAIRNLLLLLGLFLVPVSLLSQSLSSETPVNDSIIQLTAEAQGLEPVTPESLPPFGTFWVIGRNGFAAPYPCLPKDYPVYRMADGQYLVDGTDGQVSLNPRQTNATVAAALAAQAASVVALIEEVQTPKIQRRAQTMSLAGGPTPPGAGGGTNVYYPNDNNYTPPDFGTNLYISQFTITNGYLTGVASNTLTGVPYEVLSNTNLTTTNWVSTGLFLYGSEATNWTALPLVPVSRTNGLFFRLRSAASSDGSGLPDWWEQEYGVTDPFGDPDGDGWNNYQELQNGTSPLSFNPPPAPQGLMVSYNANNSTATLNWLPSPGPVTGYIITDSDGHTFTVAGDAQTLTVSVTALPAPDHNGNIPIGYTVQASYAGGSSTASALIPLEAANFSGIIVPGPGGVAELLVSALPANTASLRLTQFSSDLSQVHATALVTNLEVAVGSFTNNTCALPNVQVAGVGQYYGETYRWLGQTVDTNGNPGANVFLDGAFVDVANGNSQTNWLVPPYYDGRAQLKQNLVFQLRAAGVYAPFQYLLSSNDVPLVGFSNPADYVYAGFYDFERFGHYDTYYSYSETLNPLRPFLDNHLYRNFVFTPADADDHGNLTTGASLDSYTVLTLPAHYQLSGDPASQTALLSTNSARWLLYDASGGNNDDTDVGSIGLITSDPGQLACSMASGYRNWFGLPYVSANLAHAHYDNQGNLAGLVTNVVVAGGTTTFAGYDYFAVINANIYPETAQPQFQTVEYDFWQPVDEYPSLSNPNIYSMPGNPYFSPTNASQNIFITAVGSSMTIAGYAKLALQNGYADVYGYLGQYFDRAYQITNGIVTTNLTGVLSPYGNFFATEPGPAALVTMPDIDTGERGTGFVYSVSAVIDRTQGSNLDLSFNGPDATSINNPALFWLNNNYDRGHTVDDDDFEQDDLGAKEISLLPAYQQVPDCNYVDAYGQPAIPSTRDLEDYFRLWLPGVAAAMKAMPSNYTVRLTLSGEGAIRIFQAVEPDGGTNYLFDETTASNQVANSTSLYVGLLTSSSPIVFNVTTNFNEHFIFCGARTGSAQVDLQTLDGDQNLVADAPVYLQINDIKQMYERWTVGENPQVPPLSVATSQVDNLAFQYAPPTDANTPYILLVHGWNMETWEKDRYAEAAYKRLYWQGYKGRFGFYRWPTGNGISDTMDAVLHARNYDNSEYQAWQSATGLTNLLTKLDTEYPGNVYLMAHSMGNVVAGEALRKANDQLVNTYIAMQGAVPAHAYDPNATTRAIVPSYLLLGQDDGTPNRYANYYTNGAPCYFAASAGAGTYVNFFNTNDYALSATLWQFDQNLKPDNAKPPGYHYSSSSGFYKIIGAQTNSVTYLSFPQDTYEIFAYGDEARCYALGAQKDVGGVFKPGAAYQQVELNAAPYSFSDKHKYHSGEFRSDNAQRAVFWNTVLVQMNLK